MRKLLVVFLLSGCTKSFDAWADKPWSHDQLTNGGVVFIFSVLFILFIGASGTKNHKHDRNGDVDRFS